MELDLTSQTQRYLGLDEREILRATQRLSNSCKTMIDIGANDGYYTLAFLQSAAERVVACEPGPPAELLLQNALANGYQLDERFSIEVKPIGSGPGCVKITDLLADLPRPIFIKVDIDGGEHDLLLSAETYPFFGDIRWLIETHSVELESQCVAWLTSHGYETRIIDNAWWRALLPELRPLAHNRWLMASISDQC